MKEKIHYTHDDLVILIKNKNQKAFTYLYDNYGKAIFTILYTIIKDTEESEDVLQKVFLKIWDNIDSYDASKGRLYTWMLNLSRNSAIDYTRSKEYNNKNKNISQDEFKLTNIPITDEPTETIGLKKIVEKLKSEHAILIDLAYYKGYTQEEISQELNIPIGTVKTRIRKALLILRGELQKNSPVL